MGRINIPEARKIKDVRGHIEEITARLEKEAAKQAEMEKQAGRAAQQREMPAATAAAAEGGGESGTDVLDLTDPEGYFARLQRMQENEARKAEPAAGGKARQAGPAQDRASKGKQVKALSADMKPSEKDAQESPAAVTQEAGTGQKAQPDGKVANGPMNSSQKKAEKAMRLRTDPRERAKDLVNASNEDAGQRASGAVMKAAMARADIMAAADMLIPPAPEPQGPGTDRPPAAGGAEAKGMDPAAAGRPLRARGTGLPGNAGKTPAPDRGQDAVTGRGAVPGRDAGQADRSRQAAKAQRPEIGATSQGKAFARFDLDRMLSDACDTSKAYGTVVEMASFTHVNGRPVSVTHGSDTLRFEKDEEGNTRALINGARVEPVEAAKFLVKYDRAVPGAAAALTARLRLAARDPFQKGMPAPAKAPVPVKGKEAEKAKDREGKAEKAPRAGREAGAGR